MRSDKRRLKSLAQKLFSEKVFNSSEKDEENIKAIRETMAKAPHNIEKK